MGESPNGPECGGSGGCAQQRAGVSRRVFIKGVGAAAAAGPLVSGAMASNRRADEPAGAGGVDVRGPGAVAIALSINGQNVSVKAEPATTLLGALRLHLGLTGSKEICDRGSCGGCSVLVDGRLVNSCMMLAIDAEGSRITTVEGLAKGDELDPVQRAFVEHDALQCGYCTPGLVMACRALLNEQPKPTLEQIKHATSGNICRCGTYTNVFNAALAASGQSPIVDQKGG